MRICFCNTEPCVLANEELVEHLLVPPAAEQQGNHNCDHETKRYRDDRWILEREERCIEAEESVPPIDNGDPYLLYHEIYAASAMVSIMVSAESDREVRMTGALAPINAVAMR
jgi:hypothetical protein